MSKAPIDRLPPDVRDLVDSVTKLLVSYMPGGESFEILVGRNVVAEIKFRGGPITRDVIEDTMAHLAFYKKYFPKDANDDPGLNTPEKIISALATQWEVHREELSKQTPAGTA